jgi:C1A family cysteine protease
MIHTAMSALSQYGVCRAKTWPYNPQQDDDNESQGPPPNGAIEAAVEFRMTHSRTVEPSLVEHYKQMLAGDKETPGMPVVFGALVFKSWYMSAETHRTGKITMPLPGEQPLEGGHAMCVVGYVDDDAVPGGGYFIVRNSWGDYWAADSPEAPGHALIPYAYVEQFSLEAFTGTAEKRHLKLAGQGVGLGGAWFCPRA